jgi:inhibitor of cysteine peptidase
MRRTYGAFAKALVIGVVAMSSWAYGAGLQDAAQPAMRVTVADSGRPVSLKLGDTLEVRLNSNPSTGFSWSVVSVNHPVLERVSNDFRPSGDSNVPGAGGTDIWLFKAVKTGKQSLRLVYRRPSEKDTVAAKTVFYRVVVQRVR